MTRAVPMPRSARSRPCRAGASLRREAAVLLHACQGYQQDSRIGGGEMSEHRDWPGNRLATADRRAQTSLSVLFGAGYIREPRRPGPIGAHLVQDLGD
jgi:hypothetical protein